MRTAFKGQIYSAPMDWRSTIKQIEELNSIQTDVNKIDKMHNNIPEQASTLVSRVQLQIQAGLVDLNRLIKQATVRRNVIIQLIRMFRDAGHPDYKNIFQDKNFYNRLYALNPIDTITVYNAEDTACNGMYKKQEGMKNENNWYKNNMGSCIMYECESKRWILTGCESTHAEYSALLQNNNKTPPNGMWYIQNIKKNSCIVHVDYMYVIISKSNELSLNGRYVIQDGEYNDRPWYKQNSGASIFFKNSVDDRILKPHKKIQQMHYIDQNLEKTT